MSKNRTTFEEMSKRIKATRAKTKAYNRRLDQSLIKQLIDSGKAHPIKKGNNNFHGNCDRPGTMENGTATIMWLAAMLVSILFKHGWILCILETILWWKFVSRHK